MPRWAWIVGAIFWAVIAITLAAADEPVIFVVLAAALALFAAWVAVRGDHGLRRPE